MKQDGTGQKKSRWSPPATRALRTCSYCKGKGHNGPGVCINCEGKGKVTVQELGGRMPRGTGRELSAGELKNGMVVILGRPGSLYATVDVGPRVMTPTGAIRIFIVGGVPLIVYEKDDGTFHDDVAKLNVYEWDKNADPDLQ